MTKILSIKDIQRKYSEPTEAQLYTGTRGMLGKLANPMFSVQMKNNIVMTHGVGNMVFKRNSKATYLDIYNRLRVAEFDEPRFEKDGLLIENEPSTNMITFSSEFEKWQTTNSIITSNAMPAPDGNDTADRLKSNGDANVSHFIEKAFANNTASALTSNTYYTFSVFVRKEGLHKVRLMAIDKNDAQKYVDFDIDAGTVIRTGGLTENSITNIANSWVRISGSFNTSNGSNTRPGIRLYLLDNAGNVTFDGNNTDGVLLWGAQLEQLPYPSSYIPTSAAPAKREAEQLWAPFEYNFPAIPDSSFSVIVDFNYSTSTNSWPSPFKCDLDNSRMSIHINNSDKSINWWDKGNSMHAVFSGYVNGEPDQPWEEVNFAFIKNEDKSKLHRFALIYDANSTEMYASLDNTKFSNHNVITNSPNIPTDLSYTKLELGAYGFNGHISSVRIYNDSLTEAELGVI